MKFILGILILLSALSSFSQNKKKGKLELKKADKLKAGVYKGQKVNKVIGNVMFKYKKTYLYCDSAYQYVGKNSMDAFGRVKITDKDNTVTGKRLHYDADTKKARIEENVKLRNDDITLSTDRVDYDLVKKIAYYYDGGTINETDGAKLTSETGVYFIKSGTFVFSKDVVVTKNGDKILSDSLHYNKASRNVRFFGPSHIYSKDKTLYAKKGQYNIGQEKGYFVDSAWVETLDYKIVGDSLYFDNAIDYSYAKDNVTITSKIDSAVIYGQEAIRNQGKSTVMGNPYLVKLIEGDTMMLGADTLIAVQDTANLSSYIQAYHQVQILTADFSGICDSLYFSESDSVIQMYHDPVIWNGKNQITADSISARMGIAGIDKLYAIRHAFIISHDTLTEYNQIKGRRLTANFDNEGNISTVYVNGNGQTLYFAREDDKGNRQLIGMNKIDCSKMLVNFGLENNIDFITFYNKPEAQFIPAQHIEIPDKRLKGFRWRVNEQPTKSTITDR